MPGTGFIARGAMSTSVADRTPLHDWHVSAGARMIEFGGWAMPLQYAGIVEEHLAVRRDVGVFDVAHMGKLAVEGRGARAFLDALSANAIPEGAGRCRYTHFLRDDGTIVDDVIVTCLEAGRYLVVCNAGSRRQVVDWLGRHASDGVSVEDRTHELACVALQGPRAPEILRRLTSDDIVNLPAFRARAVTLRALPSEAEGWGSTRARTPHDTSVRSGRTVVSTTGYTGEAGFELFPPAGRAQAVWEAILAAGADLGVRPVGLGARDTLRLERGYLLAGQDFDGRQTPLEVNAAWVVKWTREFVGRAALLSQRARGDHRRLVGVRMDDRAIPRHGQAVLVRGSQIGVATSGTFSPSLRVGIALASVGRAAAEIGTALDIDVRGVPHPAHVVRLPFL
ncbi:MAG: glycine cleavage system aminomethyltransferase GcvT [Methanobacteriota archaeon]